MVHSLVLIQKGGFMLIKPKVVVSRCLGFDHCRYNGQVVEDFFIEKLKNHVEFITVCPEVEIGLGIPRDPIRIIQLDNKLSLVQPNTDKNITREMESFIDDYLSRLSDIDGFILKNRSPSCGILDVKIYKGNSVLSSKGAGFFGSKVVSEFPFSAIEDEGRLKNFTIREHFLIKLFAIARFRNIKKSNSIGELVAFQTENKLLFMAYNDARFRKLGKIVANHEKLSFRQVAELYEQELILLFRRQAKYTGLINAIQHAFGGFSDNLSKEEKMYFLNNVEEYRDERIPLSTVTHLLMSSAIRFNNRYLMNQTLLNPYPKELNDITDSGKGRNF